MIQQKQAFTLIEFLVVVLIIGILAAVAVPQYQKAVLKSRMTQGLPYLRAVYDAQQVYFLANGEYADTLEQLDISPVCPNGWKCVMGRDFSGADIGSKKAEIGLLDNFQLIAILYYGTGSKIEDVDVYGKPYCVASMSDAKFVNVCKTFGPAFSTSAGYFRSFISQ